MYRTLIERGRKENTIRADVDPLQLSINIASLGFFYFMSRHTLSTVFQIDLGSQSMIRKQLDFIRDMIGRWICPDPKP